MSRLIDADALMKASMYEFWQDVSAINPIGEHILSKFRKLVRSMPTIEPEMKWIPCSERLPEEKDSIFAKFYGTDKWRSSMMRKRSKKVIVTVEYSDGERQTDVASTNDGRWADSLSVVKKKVIAWMPLPEPYKGDT